MFPVSDVIPSRTKPYVTIALIVTNTLAFLYELQLSPDEMFALAHGLGIVPADFAWPKVLTSIFIHDGWIHFGANMLCLWVFGDNVENVMGRLRYLLFYFGAALVAALAHTALHPASAVPMIGASSAVAAVMGAYVVVYPRSRVLTAVFLVLYLDIIEVPAILVLGIWLLLQLSSGLATMGAQAADAGVAFVAHVTGFAAGAAAGLACRRRVRAWD